MRIKVFFNNNNMEKLSESTGLLSQALRACGAPPDAELARSSRGRPYAKNAPWLRFSVTHTGSLWVCAVVQTGQAEPAEMSAPAADCIGRGPTAAPARDYSGRESASGGFYVLPEIGIDAEYADRHVSRPERIVSRFFSAAEQEAFAAWSAAPDQAAAGACREQRPQAKTRSGRGHDLSDAAVVTCCGCRSPETAAGQSLQHRPAAAAAGCFLSLWTQKEAYLKMLGTGFTDKAYKKCALTDHAAHFLTGSAAVQLQQELSAAAGRQLYVSLCIGPHIDEDISIELIPLGDTVNHE